VLGQKDDDGNEYLCGCVSRSLNKHEKNYPSYKGELLALAWAVRSFRTHVHGTKFQLFTDLQPLDMADEGKRPNRSVLPVADDAQEYDFDINHRPGAKHQNDVLSRFPCKSTDDRTGARICRAHRRSHSPRSRSGCRATSSKSWPGLPRAPLSLPTSVTPCPEHALPNHVRSSSVHVGCQRAPVDRSQREPRHMHGVLHQSTVGTSP
jgi:hypothetical protein